MLSLVRAYRQLRISCQPACRWTVGCQVFQPVQLANLSAKDVQLYSASFRCDFRRLPSRMVFSPAAEFTLATYHAAACVRNAHRQPGASDANRKPPKSGSVRRYT
eukprot:scaffold197903_cov34-Prasinocladus_malaysianus.AAC.2